MRKSFLKSFYNFMLPTYTVVCVTRPDKVLKFKTDNYDLAEAKFKRHCLDGSIDSVFVVDNYHDTVIMKNYMGGS